MLTDEIVTGVPRSSGMVAPSTRSLAQVRFEVGALDPMSDSEWDELADSHPDFTVFHSSAWMRVLSKTYHHKPLILYWSQNGRPVAALPLIEVASWLTGRRGVSLPFSDFCEPLFFGDCDPNVIFNDLRAFGRRRGWKHFEIRGRLANTSPHPPSLTFHGHSLNLCASAETLFDNFAPAVKRAIRKAKRSCLTVNLSSSETAIREFYRLHVSTRRRHGLPPQPLSFFGHIQREIIEPGLGFVVLAKHNSNPIAAAVFLHTGRNALFKFGASDERNQNLRSNNLVMWHAIQHLAENGFETLHLGRTSPRNEGLRRFKSSWGALEKPIEYFRFDPRTARCTTSRDNVFGLHNALFSRLPLILSRLVGTAIYPHLD